MILQEKIQQEFKEAFKSKDKIKLSTLKILISEIKNEEIKRRSSGKRDLSAEALVEEGKLADGDILTIITREIKKRKESIEIYDREGRIEQADQEKKELEVLSSYLPEQLSESEIKDLIKDAILKSGASDIKEMGKVMGILAPQIKGKADGSEVSRIVKESLS